MNLLRFIQNRYRRVFVTFDLDSQAQVEKTLGRLGLKDGIDYTAVGANLPGRKNIEGLLPDHVKAAVRSCNPELVDAASSGVGDEQKSARNHLKRLYLSEFQRSYQPGEEYCGGFYPIIARVNQKLRPKKEGRIPNG